MTSSLRPTKTIGTILSENMIFCIVSIMSIGLFMVMNATSSKDIFNDNSSLLGTKQLIWDTLSISVFSTILLFVPLNFIKKTAPLLGILTITILALVLVFGTEIKGATRWFRIGSLNFQPSEMSKITSIVFFSWYLDKNKNKTSSWLGMIACMLLILIVIGLIALEPDLGSAVLILIVLTSMLFVAGAKISHLASLIALVLPPFFYFMYTHFAHVKKESWFF